MSNGLSMSKWLKGAHVSSVREGSPAAVVATRDYQDSWPHEMFLNVVVTKVVTERIRRLQTTRC